MSSSLADVITIPMGEYRHFLQSEAIMREVADLLTAYEYAGMADDCLTCGCKPMWEWNGQRGHTKECAFNVSLVHLKEWLKVIDPTYGEPPHETRESPQDANWGQNL